MNPVALVTGAGSGVGRSVALELAKRNYRVALLGRRIEQLQATIALAGKTDGSLTAIACDVSVESDVQNMIARVRAEFDEPTVLVNAAGINIARRSLAELSVQDFKKVLDVNLTGSFLCVHAVLPGMRKQGRGTIVNIISDAGLAAPAVAGAAYTASKFGLTGLTETINIEERHHGIRACGIFPGEINTPLLDKRPVIPPADARAKMLQPEDVAACVMLAIDLPDRATIEKLLVRPRTK